MHPPFWFSTLESKKATLILLDGKLRTSYLKKRRLVISSELLNTFVTLDSMTCNMEGHIKLFDRLSDPSGRLIHRISHPSEEQIPAEPFICVRVHGFSVCNPQ